MDVVSTRFALTFILLLQLVVAAARGEEEDYYKIITYSPPDSLKLEVSGLALLPDGRMAAALRKGEIWIIEDAETGDPADAQFRPFATGLHEPLGLAWHDSALYTVQRTELTRIRDTDQDGLADEYLTVARGWGVSGAYHEYAYGPQFDPAGNAWITLNCSLGPKVEPDDAWRGWSLVVRPDGHWEPVSGGFRSPCGLGINLSGDVFATDQQGNWFPTCPLIHIQKGVFHGHADSLKDTSRPEATFNISEPLPKNVTVVEAARVVPHYLLPAVWFPYRTMGMSSTDILCDTNQGAFGPFAGQLFVGEFTMSLITRVFLEKIDGEYQGACFRFREGFQCAVLRLAWGADHSLFVGESNRGWNSLGPRSYGLQRLVWTGMLPFEIREMRATPDGFQLLFTQPVDPNTATNASAYTLASYTYHYHQTYGSDQIDVRQLQVGPVEVAPDHTSVNLRVRGLREGYVHELNVDGLRSQTGLPLVHPVAAYTLNRIPKR